MKIFFLLLVFSFRLSAQEISDGSSSWGVNFDFLPTVRYDKIEYHKSAKKYLHHLFEWTDEYSNFFIDGQLTNGVTTHFGLKDAKKSIATLFER